MKNKIGIGKISHWETTAKSKENQRLERIKKAFLNESGVKIIAAKSDDRVTSGIKLRVAAYCRVSTDNEKQLTSYTVQTSYYSELINNNPQWELAGIYADEGLSGTSTKNRVEFLRMIEDCKSGKIDLVITKDVSRFSRNTLDCLIYVRTLLSLKNPVSIFFEDDNLKTDKDMSEEQLIIRSMVAQVDSERKSNRVKWSRRVLFKQGIALIPTHCLLGYTKDVDGNVVIEKRQAKVVRFIYENFLDGKCAKDIAQELTDAKIPTVKNRKIWNPKVILNILRNEKYKGAALMQKTYTVSCFSHQVRKNTGQLAQYYKEENHEAIIAPNVWEEVQKQLVSRRFTRSKKIKPEKKPVIKQIKKGDFSGFEILSPKWTRKEVDFYLQKFKKEE